MGEPPTVMGLGLLWGVCRSCGAQWLVSHTCSTVPARTLTPHKCPVCEGRGRVDRSFYGDTMNGSPSIVCQSCHGAGLVWS
jgi:DnaJ-class molecular chaperone